MEKEIIFLSGFPRAGTTLISNILAENPNFHVTPTSGLINDVKSYRDNWSKNGLHKTSDENYLYPKIKGMLRGMLYGFHNDELEKGKIIIEKNRGWISEIDMLEDILGKKIKIIYPLRYVIDVLTSMEKLKRKSKINSYGDMGNKINEMSTIGRAENLLKKDEMFGTCIEYLREIIYSKYDDRLIFINYNKFLLNPIETFNMLYERLELEHFEHDFNNIKQYTKESDLFHGYIPNILHKINEGKLTKPKERDKSIFDDEYINNIENERYSDITEIINKIN